MPAKLPEIAVELISPSTALLAPVVVESQVEDIEAIAILDTSLLAVKLLIKTNISI